MPPLHAQTHFRATGSDGTTPIGWYVHLPFCTTKCGYCDFYSLPTIPEMIDRLIQALSTECESRNPHRPVESVFIGGGTPTVLPATALQTVLELFQGHVGRVSEWTVEANPSSTDELKLDLLRRSGVDRISFGAQSFDSADLAVLQRLHDPAHIVDSVRSARAAGFDNINLDLIYAIPGQPLTRWRDTLRRAIDLGTDHLSCYALMYEPGTQLTRLRVEGRLNAADEDLEVEMFELTIDELTAAGFDHYEISNFARPGRQCRANLIYWENREYVGIGPSAVSYLDGVRRKNVADVRRYIEGMQQGPDSIVAETEQLSPLEAAGETAVQMLRRTSGIGVRAFFERTGHDPRRLFLAPIERLGWLGLIEAGDESIRLTRKGLLLANRVMEEFLLADSSSPTAVV